MKDNTIVIPRHFLLISAALLSIIFCNTLSYADTVYLKNERKVEGIILREDDNGVEVNMGFGTIAVHKSEIKAIERSRPEEKESLYEKWDGEQAELTKREAEYAQAREQRAEQNRRIAEEETRAKVETAGGASNEVQLLKSEGSKDMLVEAVLNGQAKATLIVDTGAEQVVLIRRIGEALGVNLSPEGNDIAEIHLAGRKRPSRPVMLEALRLGGIEEAKVVAFVLLDDVDVSGLKDGLLGTSFLNRFHCQIDLKRLKMTLDKIKK